MAQQNLNATLEVIAEELTKRHCAYLYTISPCQGYIFLGRKCGREDRVLNTCSFGVGAELVDIRYSPFFEPGERAKLEQLLAERKINLRICSEYI